MVDSSLLHRFYQKYTERDSARLKSLSCNGSLSWLHVPYNVHYGCEINNHQFIILKNLVLGSKITNKTNNKCSLCKAEMCQFGDHALSCPMNGMMTIRHDSICDKLYDYLYQAGFEVEKEQRYDIDKDGNKTRIQGRPGDVKIKNFFTNANLPSEYKSRDLFVDITCVNIFAQSYLKTAAKYRGKLAKMKQENKLKKYQNSPNVMGIGIEVLGAVSPNGKAQRFYCFKIFSPYF